MLMISLIQIWAEMACPEGLFTLCAHPAGPLPLIAATFSTATAVLSNTGLLRRYFESYNYGA